MTAAFKFLIVVIAFAVSGCGGDTYRPAFQAPTQPRKFILESSNPELPERVGRRTISVRDQASPRPASPSLQRLANGHYRLNEAWTVLLNGKLWTVQKGYTSNGITAPNYIKSGLGDGINRPETWSAVFHDWLFTQPGITRKQADDLFRDLLLAYRVNKKKVELMHSVVTSYSRTKDRP